MEDQTCTVPHRNLFENLYLTIDIITHATQKATPLYIISYDMKNAFDSIEYTYALKVLHGYNFGENFITFIKNMYTNRKLCVMNNGNLTGPIIRTRAWDQGCAPPSLSTT